MMNLNLDRNRKLQTQTVSLWKKMKKVGTNGKKTSRGKTLLDRIEECDREGQVGLDISDLGLTTWPQESGLVPSIKFLTAAKNKLTRVPALDGFRVLVDLNLSRNFLSNVNEVNFGHIINLKKLDLSRNQLETLPSEWSHLVFLDTLLLQHNLLSSLPDDLSHLKSLRVLDASHNRLVQIGDVLETLLALEDVNFMHNEEIEVETMGVRTRRFHEKRVLLSSKAARRALITRALGVQKIVLLKEKNAILSAGREKSAQEPNMYP